LQERRFLFSKSSRAFLIEERPAQRD